MRRILIVEDELRMQQGLKDNLTFDGYEVEVAGDGRTGLAQIRTAAFDLVILDVMLPELSGFDVCRQARADGIDTPILMLTAKGEELDKVLGLELGADDYVTKPFSLRELLARVKALLRRSAPDEPEAGPTRMGRLTVHFRTYEVYEEGDLVSLTHREFELLRYLYEHAHQSVSREQLLTDVWGYEAQPTTRTVDNFILKLRQRIEPDPSAPRHILTVHGVGYKYVP